MAKQNNLFSLWISDYLIIVVMGRKLGNVNRSHVHAMAGTTIDSRETRVYARDVNRVNKINLYQVIKYPIIFIEKIREMNETKNNSN